MLWTLEYEIPSQVRKTKQSRPVRIRHRGLGRRLNWNPDAGKHFA